MAEISKITVPVVVEGEVVQTTFDIKDAAAREAIAALGNSVYWAGVTTTALTDGATTNPITIGGTSVTVKTGAMAQYNGEEFIFNGSAWQAVGKNNFGALAFKSSASGSYTPTGTVSQPTTTISGTQTSTVNSIGSVGTLPSYTLSGETLVFNAGTLPTKGANQTVVTSVGTASTSQPTFSGTAATISVS